MSMLIIRHLLGTDSFQIIDPNGDATAPVAVPPAAGYPVEGRPDRDLMAELRWYLEDFLEYPFHPETEHAERVLAALRSWAEDAFNVLFGKDDGAALFARATADGGDKLRLRIQSNDPRVLSWPWEALRHPELGPLGQHCRVERSLDGLDATPASAAELPRDRVNILLVTARPVDKDGREDTIGYRTVSRPLIDLVEQENLPVDVHVLRPPTFERLRKHLQERPRHYHILHFDGHGAYRPASVPSGGSLSGFQLRTLEAHRLKGYEGCLVFEDNIAADHPVSAPELSSLLREHGVPIVVLNACQSAMLDDAAETAFASVAASLLQAGTRSVVAMAYSLYVSGAREFLPDFYRGLFASGSIAEGVRSGRRRMFLEQGRVCARGRFHLEDWLVPVLYQQEDIDLSFAATARRAAKDEGPQVMQLGEPPLRAFVGRDGAILELERALRQTKAGILVHGLAGIGKTTLARGFVEWLARTEGLIEDGGCFWLTFQGIHSAEYVFNRLGERFVKPDIALLDVESKIAALAQVFRENRFVIVWDNFEVVAGIAGTSAQPSLPDEDRDQLGRFLAALGGGQTKVLITSRSQETWLGPERHVVALSGLRGEDRWEYCDEVLGELAIDVDREDPDFEQLMELLGGHPLTMRVLLPELTRRPAEELIKALKSNLTTLHLDVDVAAATLYATLEFAAKALAPELCPLLVPLALHERFVDGSYLEAMARQINPTPSGSEIDSLLHALTSAGLVWETESTIVEMHPALKGFLRSTVWKRTGADICDQWARAFVDIFARVADALAQRQPHEQRVVVRLHGANFLAAMNEAERLGMATTLAALHRAMGVFAQKQRNFGEAEEQFRKLASLEIERGNAEREAVAYYQLGRVAEERRNFDVAEEWYLKALQIDKDLADERSIAMTYHQLGIIANSRRDFDAAKKWYQESLRIKKKLGDQQGIAITYHQLGTVAYECRDLNTADKWYQKALKIKEKMGNELGAASTYHQQGKVAEERRDPDAADKWYRKALGIYEKLGYELEAAIVYHQLGRTAEERRNFATAEGWYHKALQIKESLGNERSAAITYVQLGTIAEKRRDYPVAKRWYQKAQEIYEKLGDEHRAASTYQQLGGIAKVNGDLDAAEEWYHKSLNIYEKLRNEHRSAMSYHELGNISEARRRFDAAEEWYHKARGIYEELGDEYGAAMTYHQLGLIFQERGNFGAAEEWYHKSLSISKKYRDDVSAAMAYGQLGNLTGLQKRFEKSGRWFLKCIEAFLSVNDLRNVQQAAANFIVTYRRAPPPEQAKLRSLWEDTGLPWPGDAPRN